MRVTYIILIVLVLVLTISCEKEKKIEYELPEVVEHPEPGKLVCLSPEEFIKGINKGTITTSYHMIESEPLDPDYVVKLPGMITLYLGEIFYVADTTKSKTPLYLMCLYGDDSRKVGKDLILRGFDCYYIDGGSYRLAKEIRKHGWNVPSTTSILKK